MRHLMASACTLIHTTTQSRLSVCVVAAPEGERQQSVTPRPEGIGIGPAHTTRLDLELPACISSLLIVARK